MYNIMLRPIALDIVLNRAQKLYIIIIIYALILL